MGITAYENLVNIGELIQSLDGNGQSEANATILFEGSGSMQYEVNTRGLGTYAHMIFKVASNEVKKHIEGRL